MVKTSLSPVTVRETQVLRIASHSPHFKPFVEKFSDTGASRSTLLIPLESGIQLHATRALCRVYNEIGLSLGIRKHEF